jgi:hypothetical protein
MKLPPVSIATAAGRISIITLPKFLNLIRRKEWPSYEPSIGFYQRGMFRMNDVISGRTRSTMLPVRVLINPEPPILEGLLRGVDVLDRPVWDLEEMVHDIATYSQMEMGEPTHLVRLGRRLWMVTNPENFEIFYSSRGYALANYHPRKTVCWRIEK